MEGFWRTTVNQGQPPQLHLSQCASAGYRSMLACAQPEAGVGEGYLGRTQPMLAQDVPVPFAGGFSTLLLHDTW